jgi:hypothetical protein
MRQLTKNERRYLVVLGIAFFLVANFLGLRFFSIKKADLLDEVDKLSLKHAQAVTILEEKQGWDQLKNWMDQHQPRFTTESEAERHLVDTIRGTAETHEITIETQHLAAQDEFAAGNNPYFNQKLVPLMANGTLESMTRWLAELQQPERFIAIRIKSLKSAEETSRVECDLEVALRYKLTRDLPSAPVTEGENVPEPDSEPASQPVTEEDSPPAVEAPIENAPE